MRPRVFFAVAAALALAIGAYTVVAPSALPRLKTARDDEAALRSQVEALRTDNHALAEEVRRLQGDPADPSSRRHLEKRAREELGAVAADEVVVNLANRDEATPAAEVRR
jgi:cell division protein FtsB